MCNGNHMTYGPSSANQLRMVVGPMSKVTVLFTDMEDRRFSSYCHERGYKKSTLIARLVRDHLDREGFQISPENPGIGSRKPASPHEDKAK